MSDAWPDNNFWELTFYRLSQWHLFLFFDERIAWTKPFHSKIRFMGVSILKCTEVACTSALTLTYNKTLKLNLIHYRETRGTPSRPIFNTFINLQLIRFFMYVKSEWDWDTLCCGRSLWTDTVCECIEPYIHHYKDKKCNNSWSFSLLPISKAGIE